MLPCQFFVLGKCNKGKNCSFSHDPAVCRPGGSGRICRDFSLNGSCRQGDHCVHIHKTGAQPEKSYFYTQTTKFEPEQPVPEKKIQAPPNSWATVARLNPQQEISPATRSVNSVKSSTLTPSLPKATSPTISTTPSTNTASPMISAPPPLPPQPSSWAQMVSLTPPAIQSLNPAFALANQKSAVNNNQNSPTMNNSAALESLRQLEMASSTLSSLENSLQTLTIDNMKTHFQHQNQVGLPPGLSIAKSTTPCKFFLSSTGCTAGETCRYAHVNEKDLPDVSCGICFENLAGKRIGILTHCDHLFCYTCIRGWRSSEMSESDKTKEVTQTCPICRVRSYFIVPSDMIPKNDIDKREIIEEYREKCKKIPCKYGDQDCPFGISCMYFHHVKDPARLNLRFLKTADGFDRALPNDRVGTLGEFILK